MNEEGERIARKRVRREVFGDLREVREGPPEAQDDWDVIWVLGGPTGFEEGPKTKRGIEGREFDLGDRINETRERFKAGVEVARRVTAKRTGKNFEDITVGDIKEHGPQLYFGGWNWHNRDLRKLFFEGDGESQFGFPRERLIIGPDDLGVRHTKDEIEKFPPELAKEARRIAIVTSAWHYPRAKRTIQEGSSPVPQEKVVFYIPPESLKISSRADVRNEIGKIQGRF